MALTSAGLRALNDKINTLRQARRDNDTEKIASTIKEIDTAIDYNRPGDPGTQPGRDSESDVRPPPTPVFTPGSTTNLYHGGLEPTGYRCDDYDAQIR